jgi:hypothetical protein
MKRYILIILATLAFASCSNDANDELVNVPLQVSAVVQGSVTRASEMAAFKADDAIGISRTDDANCTNVKYTCTTTDDGNKWKSNSPIYYKGTTEETFSAYYPYNADGNYSGVEADDFLYASGATGSVTSNNVQFKFYHKMCKITLTFTPGSGMNDVSEIKECYVGEVYPKGSFSISDGKAEADTGSTPDFVSATQSTDNNATYSAILFPQEVGTNGIYAVVRVENVNYKATIISSGTTLESGKVYKYDITINKTSLSVTPSGSIKDWENEDTELEATEVAD